MNPQDRVCNIRGAFIVGGSQDDPYFSSRDMIRWLRVWQTDALDNNNFSQARTLAEIAEEITAWRNSGLTERE